MSTGWEDRSADWIRWARSEGHDSYWEYRDAFFEILPPPTGATVEVGCGEGRVCRDLRARGYDVVGLDASPSLVAAARQVDPGGSYVVGTAEELPFEGESVDLVVTYNSLMDVADMQQSVREIGRILRRGGSFCTCVLHPMGDAGQFSEKTDTAPFVVDGSYFDEREYEILGDRDGISFLFASRRYTLESYASALEVAGLVIASLKEPPRPAAFNDRWARVPLFLYWRAVKPA